MADLNQPPLNRIPPGLLDLFGIKAGQWGPRVLSPTLLPNVDLTEWYANSAALDLAPIIPAFAVNTNQGPIAMTSTAPVDLVVGGVITVPQTEAWLILESTMSWNFSAAAGQAFDATWTVAVANQGTFFLPTTLAGNVVSVAAITQGGARSSHQPYWAYGGSVIQPTQFGVLVGAANITVAGKLRVLRLKV